ncbi:MAG: hypothetical protein GYA87_03180 [Christensenellaceae bacterium]|nr:hypothetical protein [Christensenellaceae bacterium]
MICLTPFKELKCGDKSIHDFVQEGFSVPARVISYLRFSEPCYASPGVYYHPFKPEKRLPGPYGCTDGKYFWDRDTWKYVIKYNLTLPQEFIDHVMGDESATYIKKRLEDNKDISDRIKRWDDTQDYKLLKLDITAIEELENF